MHQLKQSLPNWQGAREYYRFTKRGSYALVNHNTEQEVDTMTKTATIQAQQKWEYEVITRKTETYLTRELNGFGELGWDVVTIIYGKDRKGDTAWHAFLKRPYTGPPRKVSLDAGSAGSSAAAEETKRKKVDPTAGLSGFDLDGDDFKIAEPEPEPEPQEAPEEKPE